MLATPLAYDGKYIYAISIQKHKTIAANQVCKVEVFEL